MEVYRPRAVYGGVLFNEIGLVPRPRLRATQPVLF